MSKRSFHLYVHSAGTRYRELGILRVGCGRIICLYPYYNLILIENVALDIKLSLDLYRPNLFNLDNFYSQSQVPRL